MHFISSKDTIIAILTIDELFVIKIFESEILLKVLN